MKIITGLLFTIICLLSAGSMAQNKVTLSGKVTDQHGTPVAQATIAVENTTSGTYTDDQGKYSLQVAPGKHTFVVSFLGYQTVKQSLDIRQNKKQNFTLQESAVTLNSVEVYGKTQTQSEGRSLCRQCTRHQADSKFAEQPQRPGESYNGHQGERGRRGWLGLRPLHQWNVR